MRGGQKHFASGNTLSNNSHVLHLVGGGDYFNDAVLFLQDVLNHNDCVKAVADCTTCVDIVEIHSLTESDRSFFSCTKGAFCNHFNSVHGGGIINRVAEVGIHRL